jgi:hypothetical protein
MSAFVLAMGYLREAREALTSVPGWLFHSDFFWLDGEANLPAWYSSALLLLSAAYLYRQYRLVKAKGERHAGGWLLLALGFLWLSFDETAMFHEAVNAALTGPIRAEGFMAHPWVFVGIPVVAILLAFIVPLIISLPARTRMLFLISGALYLGGVFAMEIVGAGMKDFGMDSVEYRLAFLGEETLELAGLTLFALSVMAHVRRETGSFRHTLR